MSEARPLLLGPVPDGLAAVELDSSSLEAAHRAIDQLADRHQQAAEAAGRAQRRLEDWHHQLSLRQTELDE